MTSRVTCGRGRALLACIALLWAPLAGANFASFESPQARSLAISSDASQLFVLNTPSNTLEVYSLQAPSTPKLTLSLPTGLEPVSLAQHTEDEIWVVNHLSDSISVIDLKVKTTVATIPVDSRPGDLVFAGNPKRAFVTSMLRRTVTVLDPQRRAITKKIPIAGNDPRTLLASADGNTVWVSVFRSGNGTTIVPHHLAPPPPKPTNASLPPAPQQGLIVHNNDPAWSKMLNLNLPDNDLFEIDTRTLAVTRSYHGVGTILFNATQHPTTGDLWIANTEARNLVRFEPKLKGHAIDSRITRVSKDKLPTVEPIDLHPDLDYTQLPNSKALSTALSQPTDIVFAPHGERAYVAAFGTDRIGVLNSGGKIITRIEVGNTPGEIVRPRTKRGPRALAHHPKKSLLYVLNRLSNSLSVIDTKRPAVLREIAMKDPTPKEVKQGRGYLFDAKLSGNGTMSCASCHIDADRDGLAWDLGDPGGELFQNGSKTPLHPMKGPLLTQTLRGLEGERIFHWRADRPGLKSFNGTFASLLGGEPLEDEDLALLVTYMKSIRFAPNPNRSTNQSKTGELIFRHRKDIGREGNNSFRCVDCHFNSGGSGTFGFTSLIGQSMKASQLRGLHERDGRATGLAGFGFGADGTKKDLIEFLDKSHRFEALERKEREALEAFLFVFPTETPAIVGFHGTLNSKSAQLVAELDFAQSEAEKGKCQLVVHGIIDGRPVTLRHDREKKEYISDHGQSFSLPELHKSGTKASNVLTFLALPPAHP